MRHHLHGASFPHDNILETDYECNLNREKIMLGMKKLTSLKMSISTPFATDYMDDPWLSIIELLR